MYNALHKIYMQATLPEEKSSILVNRKNSLLCYTEMSQKGTNNLKSDMAIFTSSLVKYV